MKYVLTLFSFCTLFAASSLFADGKNPKSILPEPTKAIILAAADDEFHILPVP